MAVRWGNRETSNKQAVSEATKISPMDDGKDGILEHVQ
jgi:hypothetical protein